MVNVSSMAPLNPFEYLSSLQGLGIRMDLSAVLRTLKKMNQPQEAYPSILVGGTNGKGSICAMASSVLMSAGYTVGLYTSPHLIDVRERFRCNGAMITRRDMASCIRMVRQAAEEPLTYFEFLTILAFQYFCMRKVDVAVLEVGMGGRLDATNVVRPLVSVISNISLEHSAYLGRRLTQIAGEKAGIIKENGVCLTGASQRPVLATLERICEERQAALHRIGRDFDVETDPGSGTFSYRGLAKKYRHLSCALPGRHQVQNAALAIAVTEFLSRGALSVEEGAIRSGLQNVNWEGRLETIRERPRVILDGAHNPAGVSALCRALTDCFTYSRLIVICGMLKDKNYKGMLKRLAAIADVLILTRPAADRALPPQDMASAAQSYHPCFFVEECPQRALDRAVAMAESDDLICVTGSLYLVGEFKALLGWRRKHQRLDHGHRP